MGYRSEVVLAFDKALLPQFLNVLARCEETKRLVFEWRKEWHKDFVVSNYQDGRRESDSEHHCIIWDNIKWYDGADTRNIELFVHDNCENARFIRIGEEADDTEDFGEFAQYDIQIQTHTEIQFL